MYRTALLIGATGLIGSDIYKSLYTSGKANVIATSRTANSFDDQSQWINFDIRGGLDPITSAIKESDVIIVNAASKVSGQSIEEFSVLEKSNIAFVTELAKLIKAIGHKKIIFISTLSLLRRPLAPVITETDECAPVLPYSISKYWAERALLSIDKINGCEVFIFRISSPIPSDYQRMGETVLKKWIDSARSNTPFFIYGSGEREQDFITAGDIGNVCLKVFDLSHTGIYNIAAGKPISMTRVAELIKSQIPSCSYSYNHSSDPNKEKWNISIEKAKTKLGFAPTLSSEQAVLKLIRSAL
jgi:nucleoside-diphosphate-sugar epimerase